MNGNDEVRRLREELSRLQRERGEAAGMVQILRSKLAEAEEDNFDLRANMMTIEAEIKYESSKTGEVMQKQVSSLESKLSFMSEQLKNADRVKLRALRELEELQQRQVLEQKRLDAEKRLLATKKRKHESALYAASQSIMTRMSQLDHQSPPVTATPAASIAKQPAEAPTSISSAQTEPLSKQQRLAAENSALISALMHTGSRDVLVLFQAPTENVAAVEENAQAKAPTQAADTPRDSYNDDSYHSQSAHSVGGEHSGPGTSVPMSQSVFSQLAGHASAQVKASMINFTKEVNLTQATFANECARELHDVLGRMLSGDTTSLDLAPVFVRYLAAPADLGTSVLCSVLRTLYLVIAHSNCFREFLLVASGVSHQSSGTHGGAMEHPRIAMAGLRFSSLDDYLASRKEEKESDASPQPKEAELVERVQLRAKLLNAICRVVKNNVNDGKVVESGLSVLLLWVDVSVCHRSRQADFRPIVTSNVIQDIVLAPKAVAMMLKAKALAVFQELVHFTDTFAEIEVSARKSLFFNRCAKVLSSPELRAAPMSAAKQEASTSLRTLQHVVVRLFLTIIITYPSTGIRFVLESTRGLPNDDDRELSVVYHLAQLLHRETFDSRTLGLDALEVLLRDAQRLSLVQDAFIVLSMLVRYVDLSRELGGAHVEESFLSTLFLLSSAKFDHESNNNISQTAIAVAKLMQHS